MSPLLWLQRLFMSPSEGEELDQNPDPLVSAQHIRVVLAILVCVISAFVIWWIMV